MAKSGILHDYDLWANREPAARNQKCAVCETEPMRFQWSDYSGEGMCTQCGCPYQLKWGSEEKTKEGHYPYLNMAEAFIPIAREYWSEAKTFVYYGSGIGARPGMQELVNWLKEHHQDQLAKTSRIVITVNTSKPRWS